MATAIELGINYFGKIRGNGCCTYAHKMGRSRLKHRIIIDLDDLAVNAARDKEPA